jgi:beta-galactosidase
VPYEPGTIEVVAYDKLGRELGRRKLVSADDTTTLKLTAESKSVKSGGLLYVRMEYTDANGIWKPMEKHNISIEVSGCELKGFGNACPYNKDGYWKDKTFTYYGRALAVVRAGTGNEVTIKVTDERETYSVTVPIK